MWQVLTGHDPHTPYALDIGHMAEPAGTVASEEVPHARQFGPAPRDPAPRGLHLSAALPRRRPAPGRGRPAPRPRRAALAREHGPRARRAAGPHHPVPSPPGLPRRPPS